MNVRAPAYTNGRRGFTLIESVITTALTLLILSQVMGALVVSQRLLESTLADLELSLQSRVMREKMLYYINPDEGGLMNVCQSEMEIENPNKGWGNGVKFKPKKGPKNRLALGQNKKIRADRGQVGWLIKGAFIIQTNDVFQVVASNGTILVNVDLALPVNGRKYEQRHQIQSQIMNE